MAENETTNTNESVDVLPDWAREKLTKANNEAAKYRTEKNEAVEKAKQEVTDSFTGKVEALEAQVAERENEIASSRNEKDRIKAAIEAGIANDKIFTFADLLKGETPEELRSHAEELKSLFTVQDDNPKKKTSATDPSQGTGNDHLPLNGDPLLESVMAVINKKR